jgi:hypothetical protein
VALADLFRLLLCVRGSVRIAFIVALIWCVSSHAADTATLAGRIVRPGGTLEIQFPIDKAFQDVAAEGGNPRPTQGRALVSFPKGFDPARAWPILVVLATTDAGRTNIEDAPFYQAPAIAEGWLIAGFGRDDYYPIRLDELAAGASCGRARSPAQRMAAIGALAGGLRGFVRRRKTQRRDRRDSGEHERRETVRIFSCWN